MRELLNSIQSESVKGLRDRAAIAVIAYTFARVSAVAALKRLRAALRVRDAPMQLGVYC